MATTRIMPLHVGKGRTESRAISDIIDYVANPQKTDTVSYTHLDVYKRQMLYHGGNGLGSVSAWYAEDGIHPVSYTHLAAEFYGIEVKRNGMACCPFHDDKNPSMKVDQRFHCFGCGADGDVIDFTAKLFDLSPKEAAKKLAQECGLIYDSQAPPRRRYVRQKTEAQRFREEDVYKRQVQQPHHGG